MTTSSECLNFDSELDKIEEVFLGSSFSLKQFEILRKGLPFYNWKLHLNDPNVLTFNDVIGMPQKNSRTYPLFDYEQMLFDTLQTNKHVWIKKATGLGITEFMLRYMAWLCFQSAPKELIGSQMCIVVGPNIEKAIELIRRMKHLFMDKLGIVFDSKETVIELNGVRIEAYPSHHLDAMRSLTNPKFIFIDEGDFFPPGQQQDARDVSERYIAKSNPWIVMVSTPNAPEGLFERIEKEPESTCLYKRLFLDYTYGLNKIYTQDEISAAKASPSFEREYNLKYLGLIGNVFHLKDIDAAIRKGRNIRTPKLSEYIQRSMGLDPGFGSSNFGVCVTELVDGTVNVLHAEEYQRPDFNEMIEIAAGLIEGYHIDFWNNDRIFVDGSNPSFIRALKQRLGEDTDYENQIARWKADNGANIVNLDWLAGNMFVLPVPFGKEHKRMLAHTKSIVENSNERLAIHPKFNKLITALRTAVEKGEGSLDKETTSFDDCFDAFRLSLQFWHYQ